MKNWYGAWAFFKRECWRFVKVWLQTIAAPLISSMLYFVIFGGAIGSRVGEVHGISYLLFLVPGLAAMGMLQHSFQNSSSSIVIQKYLGTIQSDMVALPLTPLQVVLGYMGGSILRGCLVGTVVLSVAWFFVPYTIENIGLLLLSGVALTAIFGLLGVIVGIWGNSFDQMSAVLNFILTPLIYLGGVFYSTSMLPDVWKSMTALNPIFYLVDLFRYSLVGISESNPLTSLGAVLGTWVVLFVISVCLIRSGWRVKP